MSLVEDFEALRLSLDGIAIQIATVLTNNQNQIISLQVQVDDLTAQINTGLTPAQALAIKNDFVAIEARLRALLPD